MRFFSICGSRSSTTVEHRIGNIRSANLTVKSVSSNIKGFPYFGISQILKTIIDEAIDFKFGKPLGFTKAHHEIPPRRKVGVALG